MNRKKDVLPLHPDFVAVLKGWLVGIKPSDKLFPKLERRKTWLMVKKDLERVGIPYKNADGIADFHAAGRHTHITELLRNGASLPETQKLARHSDIKLTMRYAHIGMEDQAKAVANLPTDALHGRCTSGGVGRHSVSLDGKAPFQKESLTSRNSKRLGVVCHRLALGDKMEARGRQLNFFWTDFGAGTLASVGIFPVKTATYEDVTFANRDATFHADDDRRLLGTEVPEGIRKASAVRVQLRR